MFFEWTNGEEKEEKEEEEEDNDNAGLLQNGDCTKLCWMTMANTREQWHR
ncbi:hypothetical protein M0804_014347 [Polistes exclamans]|nr:hypothetical protein M0804_014348 [Polistes exclamans]KAI4475367.1 hypothetical protein M0804_014347 [Polistes exclamans]